MEYSFSTVSGVLAAQSQRQYVPRASRPHIAWTAPPSSDVSLLGKLSRLKGDGTATRAAKPSKAAKDNEDEAVEPRAGDTYGLLQLLTVDASSGTKLHLISPTSVAGGAVSRLSSSIPSNRRAAALLLSSSSNAVGGNANTTAAAALDDVESGPTYVSDDLGNIYTYTWVADDTAPPVMKRQRPEVTAAAAGGAGNAASSGEREGAWRIVAGAHSSTSRHSSIPLAADATGDIAALFSTARGGSGWAGLAALNASSLVSVREFFSDIRIVDPSSCTVVQTYSTTHQPSGLHLPSLSFPSCVLVTEGCLATLYDSRCPSAVMTLAEIYTAAEDRVTTGEPTDSVVTEKSAAAPPPPPLVPGRLTSSTGCIRDVCATAAPMEVAFAIDRALCVYDMRKFNRLFTAASVLKFNIASVAAVAAGRAVVCSGTDTEVRLIPLFARDATPANDGKDGVLSLAGGAAAEGRPKQRKATVPSSTAPPPPSPSASNGAATAAALTTGGGVIDVTAIGPGGSFRTRLNTSVCCSTMWQGGWVTSFNGGGAAAVGISIDGEIFLAQ